MSSEILLVTVILLPIVYVAWTSKPFWSLRNVYAIYLCIAYVRIVQLLVDPQEASFDLQNSITISIVLATTTLIAIIAHSVFSRDGCQVEKSQGIWWSRNLSLIIGSCLVLVGFAALVQSIRISGYSLVEMLTLVASSERYLGDVPLYLDIGIYSALAGSGVLATCIRRPKDFIVTILILSPFLIVAVLLSRRSVVFPIIVVPILFYFMRFRPPKASTIIAAGILAFSMSSLLLSVRFFYGYGYSNDDNGVVTALTRGALSHFEEADTLLFVIDNYRASGGESWVWSSFWSWTYEVIPRGLVGDKPYRLDITKELAQRIWHHPDARHGTPGTVLSTLYIGGGILMLFAGSAAIGAVFGIVDSVGKRVKRNESILLFISLWVFFAILFFRLGDFSTALVQWLVQFIPLLAVLTFSRVIFDGHVAEPRVQNG